MIKNDKNSKEGTIYIILEEAKVNDLKLDTVATKTYLGGSFCLEYKYK